MVISLEENPPIVGDIYINTGTGSVDASGSDTTDQWVGITSDPIADGQRVVFDGTTWAIVGQESGGGLESVQGAAPIQVDDGDDANPIISIDEDYQRHLRFDPSCTGSSWAQVNWCLVADTDVTECSSLQ